VAVMPRLIAGREKCHHHACTARGPASSQTLARQLEPQRTTQLVGQQSRLWRLSSEIKRNLVQSPLPGHGRPIDPGQGGQGSAGGVTLSR